MVLTIQSDLVVWKGVVPNGHGSAVDQKEMFLNCNINVEMKKLDLLKGKMNRTPLTQVAAKSCRSFYMDSIASEELLARARSVGFRPDAVLGEVGPHMWGMWRPAR